MNSFSARNVSQETVPYDIDTLWSVLTDVKTLQELTPLVRRITPDGDRWKWELTSIPVLNQKFQPVFTALMTFDPKTRISYAHDPARTDELAAVEGIYTLTPKDEGTHLRIDITVTARMPFPKVMGPAVRTAMNVVMTQMGNGFARNLEKHLR
ncbi:SRPBCC family protein [Yimella sp. cx-573]|nr:SRPBCC family protein [Yimella sp. cx-573]